MDLRLPVRSDTSSRAFRTAPLVLLASLLVCSLAPSPAGAQPDTTRWTPQLAMQYDKIAANKISPDGERVAYVFKEAVMKKETSEFRKHIYLAAVDGSSDVQFTYGAHSNFSPKWSPSGDRIAFLSTRGDGPPQVYLMRTDGGEAYAVTGSETGVNSFEWGPEGERIAYTETNPKSPLEKKREREKRDVRVVGEEYRYAHLYVTEVRSAGTPVPEASRLTSGEFHVQGFDWAPGGETIAFAHQPDPAGLMERDISTVPADSGAVTPLVERPGIDQAPQYSPDGRAIAFTSDGGPPTALRDVYTVPASGGPAEMLAETPNRRASLIGWAAGGNAVLVLEYAGTSTHIFSVPADGGSVRQVSTGAGVYGSFKSLPYAPSMPSYSRAADRLSFTYQDSDSPSEVYISPRENFDRRRVTGLRADLPRPSMGRTELVTWTGPGGQKIEGLLTYPVGYEGGRVPLIVSVHGGPAFAYTRMFTGGWIANAHMVQVFAQRGYATLRPNPRGSDGYGKAFRYQVRGDWGGGPYRDLMAGVDRAVEMGVAHPDSLAITGSSYGGYLTAMTVAKTDRFEAASMFLGITNLVSYAGTGSLSGILAAYMGGEVWERYDTYEENSPIYRVDQVSTPTQVLHLAPDPVHPPGQSQAFSRALKGRGVPTQRVVYPSLSPKHMRSVTPRTLDWFDDHLGRDSGASEAASAGQ